MTSIIARLARLCLFLIPFTAIAIGLPTAFASGPRASTRLHDDHRRPPTIIQLDHTTGFVDEDRARPGRVTTGTPQTVTVDVNPQTLVANSGMTAQVTVTVVDGASQPIEGVLLSSVVDPAALGDITGLSATDVNGQSFGTWAVSNTVASGVLSVGDGTVTGTASLIAATGPLAAISVAPNPITLTIGSGSIFNASGFDQYGNPVATTPAWTTNGGLIDAGGVFTALTSVASGQLVTATQGPISGTAVVNIVAGPPAILVISPPSSVMSAGLSVAYTAIAYDAYNNLIGDVTANTVFNLWPASGGSFVGNVVTPTIANTYSVIGTFGAISDTTSIAVTPAALSRLAIEDAPAGAGVALSNTALSVYDTLTAYAAGYDAYNNLIGPMPAEWDATGILNGRLSPTSGISAVLTPAPILSGTGIISATYDNFTSTTGLITVQVPVLKVGKVANTSSFEPGEDVQYTLIYTNAGSVTAQNVAITETYPAGTSYILASPLPITSTDNVWPIGNLVPGGSGAIVVSLRVTDSLPLGSVLTNAVTIGAAQSASAVYTLTTPVASAPLLDVSLTENIDPVRVGRSLVYIIQYSNNGNSTAHDIRITETYPSEVTFVAANLTPTLGSHVWWLPDLGAGQSGVIIVTVQVQSPLPDLTTLNDVVTISSDEVPTPTQATQSTLVQSPVLVLTQQASAASPQANSWLTYTLEYTNTGSTYGSSVVVTDAVPNQTVFQNCAPAGCIYNPGNRIVTWNLGNVPSQETQPLTMTTSVNNNLPSGTILTNTAGIVAAENVSASASLVNSIASQPALNLTTSDGVSSAAAGDHLIYTLTYSNSGNAPAQNVVITDRIPSSVTFQSCSSACVNVGSGVYSFTLGTVNALNGGVVTLHVKVDSPLPAGTRFITNTALISTTTPGDDPSDSIAQDVDEISTVPILALHVDFDSSPPFETKIITYTLMYTNTSAIDTTGAVITVTRSPFVTQLTSGWTFSGQDSVYTVGDLAAGASGVATYSVRLPLAFTSAMASFMNRFVIMDNGPAGLPAASAMTTTVLGMPDLVIDGVSLSPSIVTAGKKFTATVTIRNAGTGRACNPNRLPCVGMQGGLPVGGYYIDAYINPSAPPPSFPYVSDGVTYTSIAPLDTGAITTVVFSNLSIAPAQQPVLYFKVDNFNCSSSPTACAPSSGLRGLIPESDEDNNVFGPVIVPRFSVYLPLLRKG